MFKKSWFSRIVSFLQIILVWPVFVANALLIKLMGIAKYLGIIMMSFFNRLLRSNERYREVSLLVNIVIAVVLLYSMYFFVDRF